MARYKVLKSVAHSFGHSFTSLMNYRAGDYVMGHLMRAALATGSSSLHLDILTGTATPRELVTAAVRSSVDRYCDAFAGFVRDQGASMASVQAATMDLAFDLSQRREVAQHPDYHASPYRCVVCITDDRGKVWQAELSGWWHPEANAVGDG